MKKLLKVILFLFTLFLWNKGLSYSTDSLKSEIIIHKGTLGVFVPEVPFTKALEKLQSCETLKKIIQEQNNIIKRDSLSKQIYIKIITEKDEKLLV